MATPFTVYKLIVMYMLKNSDTALTNSQISEFILDKEYTNYFHLQQSIFELVEADLIEKQSVSNTSYYRLTADGADTLSYFEKDLSEEIRAEVLDYLKEKGNHLKNQLLAPADYYLNSQGNYTVRCQLLEGGTSIIDLAITAPGLEAAQSMCKLWPDKYKDIYAKIMEELL